MRTLFIFINLLILSITLSAKDLVKGIVLDTANEPLVGANVVWEGTTKGVTTNTDGLFEIEKTKKANKLTISYIGYSPVTIDVTKANEASIKVVMKDEIELDEVVVTQRAIGTISSRTSVLQTQKITYDELCRAACCNLAESFVTNPSVDVSYSDAATGARQIKLLGLSGTYVQMLTENYPNFRGAAALYGLDYVPGPWMESIQVSKGTSSVKNGYEALAGQINVEYKKPPTADIFSGNLFLADNGRVEVNADAAAHFSDKLSSGLMIHYSNETKPHDDNEDGFLDTPMKEQYNIMNRWYYTNGKFMSQLGLKYLHETRTSGEDVSHHQLERDPYRIHLESNRAEFFTKNGYVFDKATNESLALIFTGAYHEQKSKYALTPYNVYQNNLYASLMYEKEYSVMHKLSAGLSMNYDDFNENLLHNPFKQSEVVTGAYGEYTFNWNDKVILLAGLRGDYSSVYDFFVTPRMHLKYNPTSWFNIRGSIGMGYRTPHVLAENNFLLASSRKIIIADNLDQEKAWNTGVNLSFYIPIAGKDLTLNAEWYYTDFMNQVVVDMDSNPHEVSFYNLKGKSYSHNMQVEATYPFFRGFTLTAAYRYTDAKTDYKGVLRKRPLVSDYKGLITASYQTPLKKWQFDATAQFNGGGRMPEPDAVSPLWDTTFKPFTMLSAQVTKYFRTWSVYAGGENLLNFTQKNPIIAANDPFGDNFDSSMIWGPVHGRKFYIGVRFNISRD
ncbi:MAG: TonB-dependent receptor domain-containing protein [Tannerellaceae bacterium]